MNLTDFPRPSNDNGIGIHLGLDLTDRKVKADLDRCLYMGMKWAVVCHESQGLVIRAAKTLWQSGIMPVLRFYVQINRPFEWGYWTKKAADALGFSPYIQIYNEPGDDREWKNEKRPKNWLEFFIVKFLKASNAVAMAGGLPGLQVLSTRELRAVLQFGFHERGWMCIHNYACGFPPDCYLPGEGVGMLQFLDLAEVFNEKLGTVPPFICGEGGEFYPGKQENVYGINEDTHAQWTVEMFSWFRRGTLSNGQELPEYLFAVCPWILSGGSGSWYGWLGEATKTIEAVRAMSNFVRSSDDVYPSPNDGDSPINWRAVSPWMDKQDAVQELRWLVASGADDYQLEERDA